MIEKVFASFFIITMSYSKLLFFNCKQKKEKVKAVVRQLTSFRRLEAESNSDLGSKPKVRLTA